LSCFGAGYPGLTETDAHQLAAELGDRAYLDLANRSTSSHDEGQLKLVEVAMLQLP
jgi:hypothetical protein